MKKTFGKIGEKLDSGLIKKWYDKVTKEREPAWRFITTILLLGGIGVFFCLIWFALLVKQGMPIGWIIFDVAIILFCIWVIVRGIIPMSKQVYKHIDTLPDKVSEKNDKVTDS